MAEPSRQQAKEEGRGRYLVPAALTLLGSVLVAALTLWVDHSISTRAEKERNARLATELISRREQAESALRKDMFGTILRGFLDQEDAQNDPETLSDRLLKLELLALNFGESLSLGPLFQEINRQIYTPASYAKDPENMALDQAEYVDRLEALARRVADRQISAVAPSKLSTASFKFDVPLHRVTGGGSYEWPKHAVEEQAREIAEQLPPGVDVAGLARDLEESKSCLSLNGVMRQVSITLNKADEGLKTVRIQLLLNTVIPKKGSSESCRNAISTCATPPGDCASLERGEELSFTLDRFNFPMIDNALLSHDQRLAIVLRRFRGGEEPGAGGLSIKGVLFPGEFASRRDKPRLDQAIQKLHGQLQARSDEAGIRKANDP